MSNEASAVSAVLDEEQRLIQTINALRPEVDALYRRAQESRSSDDFANWARRNGFLQSNEQELAVLRATRQKAREEAERQRVLGEMRILAHMVNALSGELRKAVNSLARTGSGRVPVEYADYALESKNLTVDERDGRFIVTQK